MSETKTGHVHLYMVINGAEFDETGPIEEVHEKMRKFLDEHLGKVTKIIAIAKEALK